jgi:hypothetical protein
VIDFAANRSAAKSMAISPGELATVKIPVPRVGGSGIRAAPKLRRQENSQQLNFDNDDIPNAVPPVRKP